jgi:hypothetical protein
MRRLALAAITGTLILAACSDERTESPTGPTAPPSALTTCNVTPFPLVQASALILKVFPPGKLRNEAIARAGAIAVLWNSCRASAAQRAAVDFVTWMNSNSAKLIGTQTQRNDLINLILNGVGITATVPAESPGDFGVGFFDPANTKNTIVKTQNNTALVQLEPGSFSEPTTIVISRNLDNSNPLNFDGSQFPPFFDYNAINASGNHILENGKTAIVGFCLLDPDVTYPDNIRIGHNPVQINEGSPSGLPTFEILDPVDLAAEGLTLTCGNLQPNTVLIGGFGQGLPGLANAAWTAAKRYLGPAVETLFLPEALHAATLGTLPPPGGKATSLSPFGVVEEPSNQLINFDVGPDRETTVAAGTLVNTLYAPLGVTFEHAGTGATCGTNVYANSNQPTGFGSSPNVVSLCNQGIASDISENTFGLIQADLSSPAEQVCIDVDPVDATAFARLDAFDGSGTLIGSSSSTPGLLQTLCFTGSGIRRVQFSGAGDKFARFDNLQVNFTVPILQ